MNCYNLKDPDTPIANGRILATLTNIIETVGESTGLVNHLCKDSGIYCLRDIQYSEPPTAMPVFQPTEDMVKAAKSNSSDTLSANEYLRHVQEQANVQAVTGGNNSSNSTHKFHSCRDFYISYKSGRTTPTKVAEQLLGFITESGEITPPIGAVWSWNRDLILKQAKESTSRYAENAPLSIVDGVPVIVKDEVDVEGYETGVGTKYINKGNPAKEDAHLVALLRAHGAIVIGKSTMHEIGLGVTNFNPSTTTPRNPYQPQYSTGGSSGGSGAAVASGLCPIAIGCDGGGSVRIPSSFCGIYGLKPTQGRVSSRGEFPLAPSVATSGPMCATMEDLAIVYAIIAGRDKKDMYSLLQPSVALPSPLNSTSGGQLQGLRIGIYRQWFDDVLESEISKISYQMLEKLCKLHGAVLVDIEIPELLENGKAHNISIVGEMLSVVRKDRYKLNYQSRLELAMIASLRVDDYYRAQQQRTRSIRFLETLFGYKPDDPDHLEKYPCLGGKDGIVDVIVTPTLANLPPKIFPGALTHGESNYKNNVKTMQYMMMSNFTGIPGITAVAGYSKEEYKNRDGSTRPAGFPIGIQFMSQWWDEKRLIHIANVCEQLLEDRQMPNVWVGNYSLS